MTPSTDIKSSDESIQEVEYISLHVYRTLHPDFRLIQWIRSSGRDAVSNSQIEIMKRFCVSVSSTQNRPVCKNENRRFWHNFAIISEIERHICRIVSDVMLSTFSELFNRMNISNSEWVLNGIQNVRKSLPYIWVSNQFQGQWKVLKSHSINYFSLFCTWDKHQIS